MAEKVEKVYLVHAVVKIRNVDAGYTPEDAVGYVQHALEAGFREENDRAGGDRDEVEEVTVYELVDHGGHGL